MDTNSIQCQTWYISKGNVVTMETATSELKPPKNTLNKKN